MNKQFYFIKAENGNVLIKNAQTNDIIYSLSPNQSIRYIAPDSIVIAEDNEYSIKFSYKDVEVTKCLPFANVSTAKELADHLSTHFFFKRNSSSSAVLPDLSNYWTKNEIIPYATIEPHVHIWGDIKHVPTEYPPIRHFHNWEDIQGKPTIYPTNWANVANVPTEYPPSRHFHNWDDIQGKPTIYPTNWVNVANVPTEYPPSRHFHNWDDIQGKPTIYPTNWASISNVPTTFTPSGHTHTQADVQGLNYELSRRIIRPTGGGYYLIAGATQPGGDQLMNFMPGEILRWNVNGFNSSNFSDKDGVPRIKSVADKNTDGTFTRMLVQDSEGYLGFKAIPTGGGASDSGWVTIPLTTPDNYETGSVVQYRKKNGRFMLWGRLGLKPGVTITSGMLCCAIPNDVTLPYERLHSGMLTINVNAMLRGEAQAPKKMSLFFRPNQGYRHVIHHENLTGDIYTTEVNFYYECELN